MTPPGKDALQAVIESSHAGAQHVERGRFKLDWRRALDKIKDFQLTDPHRYVLELVQAAVAGGATRIDVSTDADDMIMTFDGVRCGREDLEQLFDFLFTREAEFVPLRQLALGVNAALGLCPKFIVVDSGDGQSGQRLRLTSHTDLRVDPLPADALLDGTRVHVRERVSWKMMGRAVGTRISPEGQLLAEHCRHLPIPLLLDGEELRRPLEWPALARQPLDGLQVRGELLLPAQPRSGSLIVICIHGVQIAQLPPEEQTWFGLPVVGVVDAPALTRNASHSDVVRDDAFRYMQRQVIFGVRKLTRAWLAQALPLDDDRPISDLERSYLEAAARMLLRVGRKKIDNPPEVEALLDVPGMVQLAVAEPETVPLRPVWEQVCQHGRCQTGSRPYDLALADLPEGMLPVLWPSAVLSPIIGNKTESVDEVLEQIASRVYNRRQREAHPREAVLEPDAALVKVPVDDKPCRMRGEFGLSVERSEKGESVVRVTFLRDRVLLGERRVRDEAIDGVAILDCPDFEPTEAWDDVKKNQAYTDVGTVLGRAVLSLLRELRDAFPALPPADGLRAAGAWSPLGGRETYVPPEICGSWPSDATATLARYHADRLIPRCPKLKGDEAAWLLQWPLFHTLGGAAVSLQQLSEKRGEICYVIEEPFGEGAPDEGVLLNITREQKRTLQRYLPKRAKSGKQALKKRRKALTADAEQQKERARNYRSAELRRQEPSLDPAQYLAVVDLPLDHGVGQAGIPVSQDASWVRFLIDGVPLPDVELSSRAFHIHAVIQAPGIEADATWSGVAPSSGGATAALGRTAVDAAPALIDALAAGPHGDTPTAAALIWRYLKSARTSKDKPLESLPPGLVDRPLVSTVDRGKLSLRQLVEEAAAHDGSLLKTTLGEGRQLTERPILALQPGQTKPLRKLLRIRLRVYDKELEAEREALQKLDRPPQPAILQQETALRVKVVGTEITGELGVPYPGKRGAGEILVLRRGIPLEVRQLRVRELGLVGVVDCARLEPTPRYDGFAADQAWIDTRAALRAAADRLVIKGCELVHSGALDGLERLAVVHTLQEAAGRRFRGDADLELEGAPDLDWRLAHAPLWENADRQPLSLVQLRDASHDEGRLWMVGDERGHVAPGRVIVRAPGEHSEAVLTGIFGDRVRDGASVLKRDDAAQRRRLAAPTLSPWVDPSLVFAVAPVSREADGESHGMAVRGEVGPWREYTAAREGLQLRLAIDGRELCTVEVPHPVRGVGHLDCGGLIANRDWNGVADLRQLKLLHRLGAEALWEAVEEAARRAKRRTERGIACHAQLQRLLLDALVSSAERPELQGLLKELPLFRTVQGQPVSATQLETHVAARGKLLVVGEEADEGTPGDGRLIVRAPDAQLLALGEILGGQRFERHDEAWAEELAGQRRRRETPRTRPAVDGAAVALTYFHIGPTSGLAGLLNRGPDPASDPGSLVELHIDRRKVATRKPRWRLPVHVWLNDDRLQPDVSFRDVVEDAVYAEAMAVAGSQIPELVARAAERWEDRWEDEPDDPLRRRLCAYVLTHLDEVRARAQAGRRSPEQRLLRAPLWACVTAGKGTHLVDTERLLEAREAGRLATADPAGATAATRPQDPEVLLLWANARERARLAITLGELRDYTRQLQRDEAHRVFLGRKHHRRVDLDAIARPPDQRLVWRAALTEAGWEGELGLLADPGGPMMVHIFVENRPLVVHQVDGPVAAVFAVQYAGLTPDDTFSDVRRDDAFDAWCAAMQQTVLASLEQVAAAEPIDRGEAAVLLRALVTLERRETADERTRGLVERLRTRPLLSDTTGRRWSVTTLREKAAAHESVACVLPETAARTRYDGDQLVLVLDNADYLLLSKLVPLLRVDAGYTAAAEARLRMEQAPTSAEVAWSNTVARAEVEHAELGLRGELGLTVPPVQGQLALLADGRVVEQRLFNGMPGLVGYLDGDLIPDREFRQVELTTAHREAIARLYEERLQQAVIEAEGLDARGRKSALGRALSFYVLTYLHHAVRHLAGNQYRRRERILARLDLPAPVLRALDLKVFELHDGRWADLATLISGDDPLVVLCESGRVSDPSDGAASLVVDDGPFVRPLLESVLGQRSVVSYDRWRGKDPKKKQRQKEASKGPGADGATARVLHGLRSALRDAIGRAEGSPLSLPLLGRIQAKNLGRAWGLGAVERKNDRVKRLQINADHPAYKATARAAAASGPTPMLHLAAAYIADLARLDPPLLAHEQALALLGRLAEHAATRSH